MQENANFGQSDDDLLFQDIVEGNAFQLADLAIEILEKKYPISPITYKGLRRIDGSEYPAGALREALLNAVIHRDYMGAPIQVSVYDDKLMVWNEGNLPPELTIESLKHKHPSRPRNPLLAGIFFKAGLIEAWGRGTLKIINECKSGGLPESEMKEFYGGFRVTLFKSNFANEQLSKLDLNDRQINAVMFVKELGKITNKDYQGLNNCSRNTASNELAVLVRKGVLLPSLVKGTGAFYQLK